MGYVVTVEHLGGDIGVVRRGLPHAGETVLG